MFSRIARISSAGRPTRWAVLLAGLVLAQGGLYGPALLGQTLLLPVDILWVPAMKYVPERLAQANMLPNNPVLTDLVTIGEPNRVFISRELREGRLPLWNPYTYCGSPLTLWILSPFTFLNCISGTPLAIPWIQVLKALVGGCGAYLFFKRILQAGYWPAVIGAWCFPLGQFVVMWALYPTVSDVVAWLPWLLLATDSAVRGPRLAGIAGLAVATGLVLVEGLGTPWPQLFLLSASYAAWTLGEQIGWRRVFTRQSLAPLARVHTAWILGALLAAPAYLPTADYLFGSNRIESRKRGAVDARGSGVASLLAVMLPYIEGDTALPGRFIAPAGNRLESSAGGSMGMIIALVLAPIGLSNPKHRSINRLWCAVAFGGMCFMLNIPVLSEIFRVFPLNVIRNNRSTFLTAWALLALAVSGLDLLWERRFVWKHWYWGALFVASMLTALTWSASGTAPQEIARRFPRPTAAWFHMMYLECTAIGMVVVLVWVVLWHMYRKKRSPQFFTVCIAVLTLAEVAWNAYGVNPQCDPTLYYPEVSALRALENAPPGRVCGHGCLLPNLGMMYRLRDIRGYDAADPVSLIDLLKIANPKWVPFPSYAVTTSFTPTRSPILDMLNLRYIVFRGTPPADVKPWISEDSYWVLENERAVPRAWVPRHVETVGTRSQTLARLARPDFDPRDVAYVDGPVQCASAPAQGTARITDEIPTRVTLELDMQTCGLVVLSDLWFPGWRATLNGVPVPILRANHALRGVEVPAGKGTLVFHYAPAGWKWGLILAGFAAFIIISIDAVRRRQSGNNGAMTTPA